MGNQGPRGARHQEREGEGERMSDQHHIVGPARGEPLAEGAVGARVVVPLSGTPDAHWSTVLAGRLVTALTGHAAVGHLRFDACVQGATIVLEGVEDEEAPELGLVLREAVEATNRAVARAGHPPAPGNMDQAHADRIAADLGLAGGLGAVHRTA
jgi:hypothetical protein